MSERSAGGAPASREYQGFFSTTGGAMLSVLVGSLTLFLLIAVGLSLFKNVLGFLNSPELAAWAQALGVTVSLGWMYAYSRRVQIAQDRDALRERAELLRTILLFVDDAAGKVAGVEQRYGRGQVELRTLKSDSGRAGVDPAIRTLSEVPLFALNDAALAMMVFEIRGLLEKIVSELNSAERSLAEGHQFNDGVPGLSALNAGVQSRAAQIRTSISGTTHKLDQRIMTLRL